MLLQIPSDREAARPAAYGGGRTCGNGGRGDACLLGLPGRNTGWTSAPTIRLSVFCARSGGARALSARSRTANRRSIWPPPGCAAPYRRHRLVEQTLPEHRAAEGPADERCDHRLQGKFLALSLFLIKTSRQELEREKRTPTTAESCAGRLATPDKQMRKNENLATYSTWADKYPRSQH
jgi:hypothetical protein